MNARAQPVRMTFRQYERFMKALPDNTRHELIDGTLVMSPAANTRHQLIVMNIAYELARLREESSAAWEVLPGANIHARSHVDTVLIPDIVVINPLAKPAVYVGGALVAIEVLSASSRRIDLDVKAPLYRTFGVEHYLVVAQESVTVTSFRRDRDWQPEVTTAIDAAIELPVLGAVIPLRRVYRATGLLT